MQYSQYAKLLSVPQENRSPRAKRKEMGRVSFARVPGLCSQRLGHAYSLLLNHLLSSFKRLSGVAATGEASGTRFGLERTAFISSSGNFHEVGTLSPGHPKPFSLFPSVQKVKWQFFI